MSHDEVVRSEGLGGWGLIILVAVIAALFSAFSQPQKNVPPTPDVAPLPTASAAVQPSAAAAPPAPPTEAPPASLDPTAAALQLHAGYVSAQSVCPVTTDHRTSLTISLVLHNDTDVTEHIEQLSPALPLGGLIDKGAVIRSGSCSAPSGKPLPATGQVLPADKTLLVTLHLGITATCPKPQPVGLDVTLSIGGNPRAEQLTLFPDLGEFAFDACHPT